MQITYERVREVLRYDNGKLIWEKPLSKCVKKGSVAGHINSYGYRMIGIDYGLYRAHRLIWLYHYGYFPENGLDHKNRDKSDNRLGNLRESSNACNIRNCPTYKNNKAGVKGLWFNKARKTWDVRICLSGKNYYLGKLKDFDEAVLLRLAAEQCLDWGNCDINSPALVYAVHHKLVSKKLIAPSYRAIRSLTS